MLTNDYLEEFEKRHTFKLLPCQRFIFKMTYGVPLDGVDKRIAITDKFANTKYFLTERDYLSFLKESGRVPDHIQEGKGYHMTLGLSGRRSGNSALAKFYTLLELNIALDSGRSVSEYLGNDRHSLNIMLSSSSKECLGLTHKLFLMDFKHQEYYLRRTETLSRDVYTFKRVEDFTGLNPYAVVYCKDMFSDTEDNYKPAKAWIYDGLSDLEDPDEYFNRTAFLVSHFSPKDSRIVSLNKSSLKISRFRNFINSSKEDDYAFVFNIPTWGMYPNIDSGFLKTSFNKIGELEYSAVYGAKY